MWTSTTTWDDTSTTPAGALENTIEKTWTQKKWEQAKNTMSKAKNKLATYATIASMTLTPIISCTSCKPDPIKPDQNYNLTIQGTSSIDKKIKDGTTAWFVEQGKTDTTFKALQNEQANIKLFAAEGRAIRGTAGIKENNGHLGTKESVYLEESMTLPLIMDAKNHAILINYVVNASNNPVRNAIIITPQDTTRTDNQGKASTTITNVNTDQYNNINHTLEGRIESDEQTSTRFDTKTFTYNLTTPTKDVIEDVNEKPYNSTITVDGNIAEALLYILHQADTIAKKTADATGDATFNIERTTENYDVIVGGNKKGYVKEEKTITLQGDQDYNISLTLNPASYTKTVNFTINSSEPTKTPKSFRGYVLVAGDTLAVANFNNNQGQLHYDTNDETEQAEVGAKNIPAHQDVKQNMTLTGTHEFNKTTTITYTNSNVPVLVVGERGQPIQGVTITGFGNTKTTGTDGKTTLDMLLGADKTDNNGLPFPSYVTSISLASDDIINKNIDVNHAPGNNNQESITARRTSYPYVININVTSSNPAKTPLGFRGAIIIAGDTVSAADYNGTQGTLQFNNALPTINAQAIARNIPYHSNAPTQNVNLDGNDNINFVANADINYFNVTGRVSQEGTGNGVTANVSTEGKNDDTDVNGDYAINNITQRRGNNNEPLHYTIDVIATGDFETITQSTTADGTNKTVNFVIPTNENTYNINLIITDVTGNEILTGKTINIQEPDGDTQQKTINNKNTAFTIAGTYDDNKKIKIWLANDNEYDGLSGTINQSLKLPISSVYDPQETKQDTLAIIIGDLHNKTTYVAFLDKNTRDNPTIRGLVANDGGNTEYNHLNAQGEREKKFIIPQTSKQGTPVPTEIQQWYQEAINIHTQHYTTTQGLQIMNTTTTIMPEYPAPGSGQPGQVYMIIDNTIPAPGNAKIGNYPETYNRGSVVIRERDGRGTAISETGGVEAFKEILGSAGIQYEVSNEGEVTLTTDGFKAFRIIQMYKGLTYPDGGTP